MAQFARQPNNKQKQVRRQYLMVTMVVVRAKTPYAKMGRESKTAQRVREQKMLAYV